jgi:hypothetical protein
MPRPGSPSSMADEAQDPLRRLEERLARASQAAERLIGEAGRLRGPTKPPPAGWQTAPERDQPSRPGSELEALLAALRSVRDLIPPEVAERLLAAVRELLLAVRAVIDWYLERLEHRRREPPEVHDIPID